MKMRMLFAVLFLLSAGAAGAVVAGGSSIVVKPAAERTALSLQKYWCPLSGTVSPNRPGTGWLEAYVRQAMRCASVSVDQRAETPAMSARMVSCAVVRGFVGRTLRRMVAFCLLWDAVRLPTEPRACSDMKGSSTFAIL